MQQCLQAIGERSAGAFYSASSLSPQRGAAQGQVFILSPNSIFLLGLHMDYTGRS